VAGGVHVRSQGKVLAVLVQAVGKFIGTLGLLVVATCGWSEVVLLGLSLHQEFEF